VKRETVLKTKQAEANHALNTAIQKRGAALIAVSKNPSDAQANADLDAAIREVPIQQATVEAIEQALVTARRMDRDEEVDIRRAGWLKASAQAVKLSKARAKPAEAVQGALNALQGALADLDTANDTALIAIYQATEGAEPASDLPHAQARLNSVNHVAPISLLNPVRDAFVLALYDVLKTSALDWTQHIQFATPDFLAHGSRGIAAAVARSSVGVESAIKSAHEIVGIVEVDAPDDVEPAIAPPQETRLMVKDPLTGEMVETAYTIDAVEVTWGASK
jgi:hypothetical protein